ncbi:hypothetical protein DEO72_LG10g3171 [Vigna unguiculata]|uniref:Uncharacterized protein n=1 Tax=Vigna unguiculata TaxID=3917 RepID=A0A4D6NG99_VIGUN|nr:hypothetical protein DEO72_LG10g3171 [Vigna unguiculata]
MKMTSQYRVRVAKQRTSRSRRSVGSTTTERSAPTSTTTAKERPTTTTSMHHRDGQELEGREGNCEWVEIENEKRIRLGIAFFLDSTTTERPAPMSTTAAKERPTTTTPMHHRDGHQ